VINITQNILSEHDRIKLYNQCRDVTNDFQRHDRDHGYQHGRKFTAICKHKSINCITERHIPFKPLLDKCIHSDCNIFVMFVLCMYEHAEIPIHIDSTLSLSPPGGIPVIDYASVPSFINIPTTPHRIMMYYLDIPEDMRGGELHIIQDDADETVVAPKTNTLAEIPGDLYHGVSKIVSNNNSCRVAIVFEEYNISALLLRRFKDIDFNNPVVGYSGLDDINDPLIESYIPYSIY
jgi:hypothetical protein